MANSFLLAAGVDAATVSMAFYGAVLLIVAGCGMIGIPVIWSWLHRRGRVQHQMPRADAVFIACLGLGTLVSGILKFAKWARPDVAELIDYSVFGSNFFVAMLLIGWLMKWKLGKRDRT